jgi:hemerythrin-like domain-containing protein
MVSARLRFSQPTSCRSIYGEDARCTSRCAPITPGKPAMPDTLALWHAEHVNFAKLLNLLESQLSLFHGGKSPDYELMLNIMFYMTHYSDVLHHPKEDLVFAKIKERDRRVAATVDELATQHAHLHKSGRELVRQLDDTRIVMLNSGRYDNTGNSGIGGLAPLYLSFTNTSPHGEIAN